MQDNVFETWKTGKFQNTNNMIIVSFAWDDRAAYTM